MVRGKPTKGGSLEGEVCLSTNRTFNISRHQQFGMQALGCGPAEHEGHVKGLVAAKKDSIKIQKSLMEELAGLQGQALAHEAQQQGSRNGLTTKVKLP